MNDNNPLGVQVGGSHYKNMPIQLVELFAMCKWNSFQSNIAKYAVRHKEKNGLEDLEKGKHYAELALSLDTDLGTFNAPNSTIIKVYCRVCKIDEDTEKILHTIDSKNYSYINGLINVLIDKYYK